jgi:signal transduction histidine kinase
VLGLVEQLKPDLVLMDIQLAGMVDGIAVAQALREKHLAPVVFLTAFAADDVLERAKLSQPFGYILKPFAERELLTALQMAIYKFKAEETIRRTTAEVQMLSRRVLQVQEAERRHLALELHDELGQALTAIKISLKTREQYADAERPALDAQVMDIVERAIRQVRAMALDLRPSVLDDLGLAPALEWLVAQRQHLAGVNIGLKVSRPQTRLPADIETAAFRIAQEALTNALRHAQPGSIEIHLDGDAKEMRLEVIDDGKGFEAASVQSGALAGKSLGLIGMQERAALVGGQLSVVSSPGAGCCIGFVCTFAPQTALPA